MVAPCPAAGRLAEGAQKSLAPAVFQDHVGRVPLGFLIEVAHYNVSPGIPINPICHTRSLCLGPSMGQARGQKK